VRSEVDVSSQPVDVEGKPESQAKHAKIDEIKSFDRLGLTPTRVPADDSCLYHSFAKLFEWAKRKDAPAKGDALRKLVGETLAASDKYERRWDRLDSRGKLCKSWTDYLNEQLKPATWGGELEILALCQRYQLRAVVLRPGSDTVLIGSGSTYVWLHYTGNHYEPLTQNADPQCAIARRVHVKDVKPGFRLALGGSASPAPRTWKLSGGGKSGHDHSDAASASSYHSLRPSTRAASNETRRTTGAKSYNSLRPPTVATTKR